MDFTHYSVMKDEAIAALAVKSDGIYVDCTCGGGGHSLEIVKKLDAGGRLICLDQDEEALAACSKRLSGYEDRYIAVKSNFEQIEEVLKDLAITYIDGALLDLGVSSYQLDNPLRGFSYMQDAPLDMRMDQDKTFTARDVVNNYDEQELKRVLFSWGEEKFAPQIARAIIRRRAEKPSETTGELTEIVKSALPKKALVGGHHPAKKTFQAVRIEVNRELVIIEPTLRALVAHLKPGGRLAVLTFHSLEDRITKQTFASLAQGCTCPKSFPVCVCGKRPQVRLIDKGREPSEKELDENPRSRSARLRSIEKIE